ncbi:MAG: PEP-CTERM sorting domain-containing protein [Thiobacillus sp.]|nr:PEP-CTERM sorting domain-containing protein [Thiobacillus sp.]
MFKQTLVVVALGLMIAAPAAQAAVQIWNFNGTVDSGELLGQTYSGSFSFDDAALAGSADEWLGISSLMLSFMGNAYSEANAAAPAEVGYMDGRFLGLSYSVNAAVNPFSFIAGTLDASDAFFAYDVMTAGGAGNVIYAPVPEPRDWMLMLSGLGMIGLMVSRSRRRMM